MEKVEAKGKKKRFSDNIVPCFLNEFNFCFPEKGAKSSRCVSGIREKNRRNWLQGKSVLSE